ncbi:hypothetical protein [Streptomyces sp. NPDC002104]
MPAFPAPALRGAPALRAALALRGALTLRAAPALRAALVAAVTALMLAGCGITESGIGRIGHKVADAVGAADRHRGPGGDRDHGNPSRVEWLRGSTPDVSAARAPHGPVPSGG